MWCVPWKLPLNIATNSARQVIVTKHDNLSSLFLLAQDIVVDLITYRRWGHNELDEPGFTQPLMYEKIRNRKSVPTLYEEKLMVGGHIHQDMHSHLIWLVGLA
jgi:hypothetical protein